MAAINVPADVSVLVEGIADCAIVAEIENTVRAAFRDARANGTWIVAVAPSETRGRWDVGLKGPSGRHIFSFAAPAEQVPTFIAQRLGRRFARPPR